MSEDRAKVEDYEVCAVAGNGNTRVAVAIYVARRDSRHAAVPVAAGDFFAEHGNERVVAKKLVDLRKKIDGLVARHASVDFRPVIVLDVTSADRASRYGRAEHYEHGGRNGFVTYGESVSFMYLRCDLAEVDSAGRKGRKTKRLWRLHAEDFEEKIRREREPARRHQGRHVADAVEARLRKERADFADAREAWLFENPRILPYADETWLGLRRIVDALRETQRRIDALLTSSEVEARLALAARATSLMLPAAEDDHG